MQTIGELGTEMNLDVVRGSDYSFEVQIRDGDQNLIDAPSLLSWVDTGIDPFTWSRTSAGIFQITLARTATERLPTTTQFSISYVDTDGGYRPLLRGVIRVPRTIRVGP